MDDVGQRGENCWRMVRTNWPGCCVGVDAECPEKLSDVD